MQLEEHTLYVIGATEFAQMAQSRIKELEQTLCGTVILKAELVAASAANKLDEAQQKNMKEQFNNYAEQIAELRARIDAVRSLCGGEFDEPKGE